MIKGKGTSTNSITISPTKNEITVYLVDITWNGQVIISGNNCKVSIVLCGDNINENKSGFFYVSRASGELSVSGLTGQSDKLRSVVFLNLREEYWSSNKYVPISRTIRLENLSVNTNTFITKPTYHLNDTAFYTDSIVLKSNNSSPELQFKTFQFKNSDIDFICPIKTDVTCVNSTLKQGSPMAGVINCTNSSLWLTSGSASSFSKINLNNCSLYSAIKFVGTPVDLDANDLYLKKIRIRQHPDTYVWVSVDNGVPAKLRADANGYLYPYVKAGTTSINAHIENGDEYYATFPGVTKDDSSTTNLIPSEKSSPVIESYSENQRITVGGQLRLFVTARPGTSGSALSYQWYKNNTALQGETKSWLEKAEAVTNDSGLYHCIVQEDKGGATASEKIEVTVIKPSSNEPVILSQAADMELIKGSSVTLRINAIPCIETDTLSYQWYKNNMAIDATDSKLELTDVSLDQAGSYKCIITEENLNTTAISESFQILVKEYPM